MDNVQIVYLIVNHLYKDNFIQQELPLAKHYGLLETGGSS